LEDFSNIKSLTDMCGVAGILANPTNDLNQLAKKIDLSLILHRGPDKMAEASFGQMWLGHTRLSILDLSEAGNQPMISKSGRFIIAFNGEIYNHLELRKSFLPNFNFRGHSDTETILELFEQVGEKMLSEMVGMWAMLIWDNHLQKLFVSRDRFGQKPLYYQIHPEGIYFGSEIKLFSNFQDTLTFNTTAVTEYLSSGNYGHLEEECFYEEIAQFPLASYSYLSPGDVDLKSHKYWTIPSNPVRSRAFGKKEKKELKDLVVQAVLSQTLSDVPIGITLSGGIDSTIVAGILAKHGKGHIHIFTAQIPGDPKDESKYVKDVIKLFDPSRITVHYVDLTQISYEGLLENSLSIQEEPFGDPSITAHGLLMKAAKNAGVKVILGGQGADELFAGYDHAIGGILSAQIKKGMFGRFLGNIKHLSWGKTQWMKFFLAFLSPSIEKEIRESKRKQREEYISKAWKQGSRKISLASPVDFEELFKESLFKIHLPHLLHYDDRNAMNEGVEGRTPFLDHRLIDFLLTIKPEEFLISGERKFLLREACGEFMPLSIRKRRDKIGFHTPLQRILIHDQDKISKRFEEELPSDMKSSLLKDLGELNQGAVEVEKLLRIYRTYSILLTMDLMQVKFPSA
jgi:asparagine synthase (glutamine-hydrolysing)